MTPGIILSFSALILTVKSRALVYGFDEEEARVLHKETYGLLITAKVIFMSLFVCVALLFLVNVDW